MQAEALHVDQESGLEKRLEYLATPRGRIYCWSARPKDARSCVVVCSSIMGDFMANYHRERLLGLYLASRGCGAIRFHYTGDGNSQGERQDLTFQSMCEDARATLGYGTSLGFSSFALVGTRIGALVAAAVVADLPIAPLVLWEPVHDPIRFVGEAQRAKRMSGLAQEQAAVNKDWSVELSQDGVLNVLGYAVHQPLIDSFRGLALTGLIGTKRRPMLVAGFGRKSRAGDATFERLISNGFTVDVRNYELTESWWFDSELAPESGNLITDTGDWLSGILNRA